MNHFKKISLAILVLMTSCHSAKKIVSPTNTPSKKDTSKSVPSVKDSSALAQDIFSRIRNKNLSFQNLSAKLSVSVKTSNLDQSVNASLRMAKDSLIWISLTGPFNIEGARAKISRDSVYILNKLNSTAEKRSIGYIQNIVHQPLQYADVQNILLGGVLLQDATLKSFKGNPNGTWQLLLSNGNIQNTVIVDPINDNILQNKLVDLKTPTRTCTIDYRNYQNTAGGWIPKDISIDAQYTSNIHAELSYKQINYNQPLDYPFNIPGKYSIRQ